MSKATDWIVVFNPTQNGVVVDEEGHTCEPNAWCAALKGNVQEDLRAERLIEIDVSDLPANSNADVTMVAAQVEELNKQAVKDSKAAKRDTDTKEK